jgi:drug/metabolite transporter (DMT)-like permease
MRRWRKPLSWPTMQPEPRAGALRAAKLLIWVIPLLWVVNSFIARRAVDVITPHVLAWGRWALAGAILAWVTRAELWQHRQEVRTHWRRYLLLGACGMWICGAAVYFAGQTTTMMNISLIYAASPVMIAVGSVLWLRDAFSKRQALGVVLALVGVVHVVVQGQWLLLAQVVFVPGDLWIAAAATAWAAYSMLQKHWGNPMSASAQLAAICAGGVVVLTPFAALELLQGGPLLGTQALALVVMAALFPGVLAYWIYGWTQSVLGPGAVAMTMYLGPLYAAVVAWLWLGEPLELHHLIGGALILSGVGLVVAGKRVGD